jgi:hypothetical protein
MASTIFNIDEFTGDNTQVKITLTDVSGGVQVKVDVLSDPVSNISGDLQGVFFHIKDETLINTLSISGISGGAVGATQFGPANSVNDINGTLPIASANITPAVFDFGVTIGQQGGNPVETTSTFNIISSSKTLTIQDFINANPDGDTGGPDGYDIGVRLQSTTGLEGSSKLRGEIPPPPVEPPPTPDGVGHTPGFWKQEQHFSSWKQPYDPTDKFTDTFGVTLQQLQTATLGGNLTLFASTNDTLVGALSAGGGGIHALARSATAALLGSAANGTLVGDKTMNYAIDPTEIPVGSDSYNILQLIDGKYGGTNNDIIEVAEIIGAVRDVLGPVAGDQLVPNNLALLATAFDAMNNMNPNPIV